MKEITLRPLKSSDIFPMAAVLKKIGLSEIKKSVEPDALSALIKNVQGDKGDKGGNSDSVVYAVGLNVVIDLAQIVLSHIEDCETELYTLISQVSGMSRDELANMGLADFAEMIVEFFQKEELRDFLKVVSKLLK